MQSNFVHKAKTFLAHVLAEQLHAILESGYLVGSSSSHAEEKLTGASKQALLEHADNNSELISTLI